MGEQLQRSPIIQMRTTQQRHAGSLKEFTYLNSIWIHAIGPIACAWFPIYILGP